MAPIIQGVPIELIKEEILKMDKRGNKYKLFGKRLKEGINLFDHTDNSKHTNVVVRSMANSLTNLQSTTKQNCTGSVKVDVDQIADCGICANHDQLNMIKACEQTVSDAETAGRDDKMIEKLQDDCLKLNAQLIVENVCNIDQEANVDIAQQTMCSMTVKENNSLSSQLKQDLTQSYLMSKDTEKTDQDSTAGKLGGKIVDGLSGALDSYFSSGMGGLTVGGNTDNSVTTNEKLSSIDNICVNMTDTWCQDTLNAINVSISQNAKGCGLKTLNDKQIAIVAAKTTVTAVQHVLQQDRITAKLATATDQDFKEAIKTKEDDKNCGLLAIGGCGPSSFKIIVIGIICLIACSVIGGIIFKLYKEHHASKAMALPPPQSETSSESSSELGDNDNIESETESESTETPEPLENENEIESESTETPEPLENENEIESESTESSE